MTDAPLRLHAQERLQCLPVLGINLEVGLLCLQRRDVFVWRTELFKLRDGLGVISPATASPVFSRLDQFFRRAPFSESV